MKVKYPPMAPDPAASAKYQLALSPEQAAVSTMVSPRRTRQEPLASPAILPVEISISRSPSNWKTIFSSAMISSFHICLAGKEKVHSRRCRRRFRRFGPTCGIPVSTPGEIPPDADSDRIPQNQVRAANQLLKINTIYFFSIRIYFTFF